MSFIKLIQSKYHEFGQNQSDFSQCVGPLEKELAVKNDETEQVFKNHPPCFWATINGIYKNTFDLVKSTEASVALQGLS